MKADTEELRSQVKTAYTGMERADMTLSIVREFLTATGVDSCIQAEAAIMLAQDAMFDAYDLLDKLANTDDKAEPDAA
jgi:hypothetical protein